jgi:peptidylprolyl isomerase
MHKRLSLVFGASFVSIGLLFAACGDGADPAPTPTPAKIAPTVRAGSPVSLSTLTVAKELFDVEKATTNPSGLRYIDTVVGTGATPALTQSVTVHYTGKLASNGNKFDSSVDRGAPATFSMTGVIAGFTEGLSTMRVGGKRTVYIPWNLAYGEQGRPPTIPGRADLIFEIELISVK